MTSSLNFSGAGDVAARVTVTGPTTVVATPTRACAPASAGIEIARASTPSTRVVVVFIAVPRLIEAFDSEPTAVQRGCQTPEPPMPRRLSAGARADAPEPAASR